MRIALSTQNGKVDFGSLCRFSFFLNWKIFKTVFQNSPADSY